MKKISVVLLLLLLSIGGYCSDMQFHVGGSGGINTARVQEDELFRTSTMYNIELSLLNFRFGDKHTIGVPFSINSYSETSWVGITQLDKHVDCGVGLYYRYAALDWLEIMARTDCYFKIYERSGFLYGFDVGTEIWLLPADFFAIRIPLTMGLTREEVNFSAGIGAVFIYTKEDI